MRCRVTYGRHVCPDQVMTSLQFMTGSSSCMLQHTLHICCRRRSKPSCEERRQHLGPGVQLVGGQLRYSYPERYTGRVKMDKSLDPGEILKEWQAGTLQGPPGETLSPCPTQQVRVCAPAIWENVVTCERRWTSHEMAHYAVHK